MGDTPPRNRHDDGWPWTCTRCGTGVYHYAATCRDCQRTERATAPSGAGGPPRGVRGWPEWMRRQSYPRFLATVSVVAGTELLLTVLWLAVLFSGTPTVPAPL